MQPTSIQTQAQISPVQEWTLGEKLLFRFFFVWFSLYIIVNSSAFPFVEYLSEPTWDKGLRTIIPWIGDHLLRIPYEIDPVPNGSGDTTYEYVLLLFLFGAAAVGSAVWSLSDRKRKEYNTLHYWLMAALRYYLALNLWGYGFEKIYKLQFPFPSLEVLSQNYGDSTPMGLAWTFMGYSKLYNYFTGFAEVMSGVLLLFRRTTTLGALVSLMVMLNVAMLNYSFDIPVKLFSTMMVVMCLFLLTRDAHRLYSFFVLYRTTSLRPLQPPVFSNKRVQASIRMFKVVLIGFVLFTNIEDNSEAMAEDGDDSPKPPLYGIYTVERFVRNNDTLPLAADSIRWSKIIVNKYDYMSLRLRNDTVLYYDFKADTLRRIFQLTSYDDSTQRHSFSYSLPDKDHLLITGQWKGDTLNVHFKKYDVDNFPLVNTGFHWINEYPNNR